MLRTLFVLAIIGIGATYTLQGPFYGLLFYLWVAYFRPETWVWNADLVNALHLSYLTGLATIIGACVSRVRWRMNVRIVLLGLFLLQTLLSTVFAPHSDYAWPFWLEFLKAVVIAYFIVVLADDADKFRMVMLVMGVSMGFEAGKQGWVELLRHPGSQNSNALPMLGDNNGVAVGMLMLVPILTTLAATSTKRWERNCHRFLAFGVLYRAICTYSRGGFLACAALAIVYVLRGHRKLMTATVIVVAVGLIAPVLPDAFWDRMNTIKAPDANVEKTSGDETSALSRLHFWNVALAMANQNPLLGVGHSSFNVNYDAYDDSNGTFGIGRSVHSSWFGLMAELGYPGLILFIAQLGLAFHACSRARRAAKLSPAHSQLAEYAFSLEAALVVFMVGGAFLPFQYTEMLWHVVALSIALEILARRALEAAAAADRERIVGFQDEAASLRAVVA